MSHVYRVTGHPVAWLDDYMDVVLIHQYEATYWQERIHEDEVSAAVALSMAFGKSKHQHLSVVSLAGEADEKLV